MMKITSHVMNKAFSLANTNLLMFVIMESSTRIWMLFVSDQSKNKNKAKNLKLCLML